MAIPTEKQVTEWLLDADQHKGELEKVFRLYKRQAAEERKLGFVRKTLDNQTKQLTSTTRMLGKALANSAASMALSVAKGHLLSTAILAVGSGFKTAVKDANQFSQASEIYTGNIELATEATKGLVSELDIMNSANKLSTLGVKLTSEEFAKLLGNTQKLATAMDRDMKSALDDVTTALSRQSVRVADNIGIVLSAATANEKWAEAHGKTVASMTESERRLAFQVEMMAKMEVQAAKLPARLKTFGDQFTVVSKAIGDATVSMIAWLNVAAAPESATGLIAAKKAADELPGAINKIKDAIVAEGVAEGLLFGQLESRLGGAQRTVKGGGVVQDLFQFQAKLNNQLVATDKASLSLVNTELTHKKTLKEQIKLQQALASLKKKTRQEEQVFRVEPSAAGVTSEFAELAGTQGRGAAGFRIGQQRALPEVGPSAAEVTKEINKATEAGLAAQKALVPPPAALSRWTTEAGLIAEANNQLMAFTATQEHLNQIIESGGAGTEQQREATEALKANSAALVTATMNLQEYQGTIAVASEDVAGFAEGALADFTSGLFAAADAAIQGSTDMDTAVAKMVKSILLGIASQAAVKAVFELAEGVAALASFNPASAAAHFTAAGIYAAVAVLAGAGGLAVSAGIAGAGGSTSTAASTSSRTTSAPTIGKKIKDEKPININVFIGDPADPSTALLVQKQVQAQVA